MRVPSLFAHILLEVIISRAAKNAMQRVLRSYSQWRKGKRRMEKGQKRGAFKQWRKMG